MIPRRLHRIWLDEEVPEHFERFWRRFEELHPDWELCTWNDSSRLTWLRCGATFRAQTTHAGRSDVLRYEVLYRYGGVYVDTDVEPLRSFEPLVDGPPFAAWEDHNMICPTVMGAPPGHPAIQALLVALPRWARLHPGPPNLQTGPHFLTRMWRHRRDVRLLPPESFYPVHWSKKRNLGGPYPPTSYAVHHWAAGWLPGGPPQR